MRPEDGQSEDWSNDVSRVSGELASRLRARGILVRDTDSPETLSQISEAVEAFEEAVVAAGGDLMVDEPPSGSAPQPDDRRFLLPTRADDETVASYLARLAAATQSVRGS